jgi:hypothetical protein
LPSYFSLPQWLEARSTFAGAFCAISLRSTFYFSLLTSSQAGSQPYFCLLPSYFLLPLRPEAGATLDFLSENISFSNQFPGFWLFFC